MTGRNLAARRVTGPEREHEAHPGWLCWCGRFHAGESATFAQRLVALIATGRGDA